MYTTCDTSLTHAHDPDPLLTALEKTRFFPPEYMRMRAWYWHGIAVWLPGSSFVSARSFGGGWSVPATGPSSGEHGRLPATTAHSSPCRRWRCLACGSPATSHFQGRASVMPLGIDPCSPAGTRSAEVHARRIRAIRVRPGCVDSGRCGICRM
jgi:hypothetical protein